MMSNKENMKENVMVFSPPGKMVAAGGGKRTTPAPPLPPVEEPTLLCARFQGAIYIEFGTVSVKSSTMRRFKLYNPSKTKSVSITVDKVPEAKGISITLGGITLGVNSIEIPAGATEVGVVFWNPSSDMSFQDKCTLKLDDAGPLQITLHGIAGTGKVMNMLQTYTNSIMIFSIFFLILLIKCIVVIHSLI